MSYTASTRPGFHGVPVPRLSMDEFRANGPRAVMGADIPVVIDVLSPVAAGVRRDIVLEHLGNSTVALFARPSDPASPLRSEVRKIPLREYFERPEYRTHSDVSYRVVTNIKNRPAAVNAIAGFDVGDVLDYRSPLSSANLWVSYRGMVGRSHFDEFENFNLQLEGLKRFILMPPGRWRYYPRSMLRGFGHHSEAARLDDVDPVRFPRLAPMLPQRREVVLKPGEMLYLPLGWWHQVDSIDEINININFWLHSRKIVRRPYVLVDALYKAAFRRIQGRYDYQPEKLATGAVR